MEEVLRFLIILIIWFGFWTGFVTAIGFLITGTLNGWKIGLLVSFWTSPMIMGDDF